MAYTPTVWKNGEAPAINAENLNKIEQGIADSVSVTPQTLSEEQKAQTRTNINSAPGGFGLGIPADLANGDVNEWHGNGFYAWGSGKPKNAPTLLRSIGDYQYMLEFGTDEGFTQIVGCYIESSHGLIYQQAFAKSGGGWNFSGWKWLIQ